MPSHLSFDQAASMPTVFLTAQLALRELAACDRGERVLLHAAAGGVGLAALQVLSSVGAVPLATAGSPAKRSLLRSLGVRDAVSSRDLSFVEDALLCGGIVGGAHAALNSLTSPGMVAGSLAALRREEDFLRHAVGELTALAPESGEAEVLDARRRLLQAGHRLAGDIDYILKVRVRNARAYDAFYQALIRDVKIHNVTALLSMEEIKATTVLPV
jgi:NADPH:quinone reductase-like Zn-dependent oxidoreductase